MQTRSLGSSLAYEIDSSQILIIVTIVDVIKDHDYNLVSWDFNKFR